MLTLFPKRSYVLSIALLCSTNPVFAGSTTQDPSRESPISLAEDGLLVVVTTGPVQLEAAAIREAIATELGVKIATDPSRPHWGAVSVKGVFGPAVIVSYRSLDGSTNLERRVPLPIEPKRRAQVVAWVVGNLVRNEAAEILDALRVPVAASKLTTDGVSKRDDAGATVEEAKTESEGGQSGEPPGDATAIANADGRSSPDETSSGDAARAKEGTAGAQVAVTTTSQPKSATARDATSTHPGDEHREAILESRVIQLSLWSPKVALYPDSERYRFRINLGGGYNRIGGLSGVGLTWLVDRNDVSLDGVQISGLVSLGHRVRGVVISGAGSYATGKLSGADLSGVMSWRTGCVDGIQIGGALVTASACDGRASGRPDQGAPVASSSDRSSEPTSNSTPSSTARAVNGVQLSGAVAVASGRFDGLQLSGATNVLDGSLAGLQLSGVTNVTTQRVDGAQITGAVNYGGRIRGLQLGLVNIAEEVEAGGQLGIVNVAKDNHGFAYGLTNWSRQVRIQPQYYFETPRLQNVGVRFLTGYSTASIAVGYDEPKDRFRTHYSFGGHLPLSRFALDAAIGYGWVLERFSHGPRDRAHELDLRGTASFDVVPRLVSVFGGGVMALPVSGLVEKDLDYRMVAGVTLL